MRSLIIFLAVISTCTAANAFVSEPTINCHCFRDRSYDHQNPDTVVPYLLATTQNSFMAVALGASKFELVKALMNGVPAEQLWAANYFTTQFGRDSRLWLSLRGSQLSWAAVLKKLEIAETALAVPLQAALKNAEADKKLAEAIVDQTLADKLNVAPRLLAELRQVGAGNKEAVLSFFLAGRTGQPAAEIYRAVNSGAANWATLAYVNNVQIDNMQEEFKRLLDGLEKAK